MAFSSEIDVRSDLNEIQELVESVVFDNNDEIIEEINSLATISKDILKNSDGFRCTVCVKVCKSKNGLIRHIRAKHDSSALYVRLLH